MCAPVLIYASKKLLVATAASAATTAAASAIATAATAAVATGSAATAAAVAARATTAAATAAARTTLALGTSFVNGEGSAVELGAVLVGHRRFELVGIDVKECESATFDDANVRCAVLLECFLKTLLRAGVRDVAYV